MIRAHFIVCFFIQFIALSVIAQGEAASTGDIAYEQLFSDYQNDLGDGAAIFNGREYTGGDITISGHQFFGSRNFNYGKVIYDSFAYDSVLMAYDIYSDQLVIVFPQSDDFFTITPDPDKISRFDIKNHLFIKLEKGTGLNTTGFYELLYNGPSRAIARHQKTTVPFRDGQYLYQYKKDQKYYVYTDGGYQQIRSKGAYLDLFKTRKKELKGFIKKHSLDFKRNPEQFLQVLCHYLDNEAV